MVGATGPTLVLVATGVRLTQEQRNGIDDSGGDCWPAPEHGADTFNIWKYPDACLPHWWSRALAAAPGVLWGPGWQPVETIPIGEPVVIQSARGIVCRARSRPGARPWARRPGDMPGVTCTRIGANGTRYVTAIAWRAHLELEQTDDDSVLRRRDNRVAAG